MKGLTLNYTLTLDNCAIARGGRTILSGLSMTLAAENLIWLTGDNGIGKSSVLKLAAGLLRPEFGEVRFTEGNGAVPASQLVSMLSHDDGLHPALTPNEEMRSTLGKTLNWTALPEAFQMEGLRERPIKTLSAGQRRRAAIARLIASDKQIWLMDEPLSALDATSRVALMQAVKLHISSGGAAIIATHHIPSGNGTEASILNLSALS